MKITTKNTYLDNFLLGILAGISIGIGGMLYIICVTYVNKYLGGVAFSIGLLTVCYFGLHLYTGKIGYLTENNRKFIISLLIMYVGNIIGAVGFGYFLRIVGFNSGAIAETIKNISLKKTINIGNGIGQQWWNMLIMGFFCCNLVFLGVDIYKKNKNWLVKIFGIVICVAIFVILGMEHCVADLFYLAVGNVYPSHFIGAILGILISTIGNSIGALVFYQLINNSSMKNIL